ncbi:MAG: type II secretion system F family protein [Eubacterium aggregans]|uniref:Type IV pilus assembly protein PilC n=1 Tax=Eubacterium aggregans TaxID=81409 RepID=A0A1H4AG40_9FIRM|nr:type II secretion system F family protein [Eubacterium aggregans]MEA5072555.1 type II secretion system F family protein [Eubacterium aggregans]SEA35043.1 type IV pilus assembly protein PilC [Eubacterium aggregans]
MAKFKYKAKNLASQVVTGTMEAPDATALRRRLREQDEFLLSSKELDVKKTPYKLKNMELADFSRQMNSMLDAGITVVRGLAIMKERDIKPKVKEVYEILYTEVQKGITLSQAMEATGGSFPMLIINMYQAGESSGQMAETALKMADYYEKEHRLHTKIRNAMVYPIILAVVTIAVVILIFTLILPQFFSLFEGVTLPAITQVMINISGFMVDYWLWVVMAIVGLFFLGRALLGTPPVRLAWDKFKLSVPKIGKLVAIVYTARFARTLSSLYSSGLSMIGAMEIGARIVGNAYITSQFPKSIDMVRTGGTLASGLDTIHGFDNKLISTVFIGEETGNLDGLLESVADSYDYESEMAIQRIVAFIEPIMIIIMAVIIGSVMLSVMMPIMSLYQNIG